jgi:hypothetical protein
MAHRLVRLLLVAGNAGAMVEAAAGPELCGPRPAPLGVVRLRPPTLRRRCCVCKASEAEEHLLHHGLPEQHPLRLIGPKQREDRGWEVVSLGDDMEVAINGLELTPGRRGGDRATLVVSGRGRGVDATVLEVQRLLLMKRRRIMRARNVVAKRSGNGGRMLAQRSGGVRPFHCSG